MDRLTLTGIDPRNDWIKIKTIDMHTEGEPVRVVLDGYPLLNKASVLEYRNFFKKNQDFFRQSLMLEPRGHSDMYGAIVVPSQKADFGVVFTHNEGYSTMCGHATIAITKLAIDSGWIEMIEPQTKVSIEAPCGIGRIFTMALPLATRAHWGRRQVLSLYAIPSVVKKSSCV